MCPSTIHVVQFYFSIQSVAGGTTVDEQIGRPRSLQSPRCFHKALRYSLFSRAKSYECRACLICQTLYGTGMRIMEAARLRVKDLNFDQAASIVIREAQKVKERVIMLPSVCNANFKKSPTMSTIWYQDQQQKRVELKMPSALEKKYPHADNSLAWFWVFPQSSYPQTPQWHCAAASPLPTNF